MQREIFVTFLIIIFSASISYGSSVSLDGGRNKVDAASPRGSDPNSRHTIRSFNIERAESLRWNSKRNQFTASGDVLLRYDDIIVESDQLTYLTDLNLLTTDEEVSLEYRRGDKIFGDALRLNPTTNQFRMKRVRGRYMTEKTDGPIFFKADKISGDADTEIRFSNLSFSPFNKKTPYYGFNSNSVSYTRGENFTGYHTKFRIFDYPLFYWPYFDYDLNTGRSRWDINPGYNSNDGFELEAQYRYLTSSNNFPLRSAVLTDFREEAQPALGLSLGFPGIASESRIMMLYGNRNASILDSQANKVESSEKGDLWLSRANIHTGNSNWRFRTFGDWIQNTRFEDDLLMSGSSRGAFRRTFDVSLVRSHENTMFRIGSRREDRTVLRNNEIEFKREEDLLPRLSYQFYPTNVVSNRIPVYFGFSSTLMNKKDTASAQRRLESSINPALTSHVNWLKGWGQSFTLGYNQLFSEKRASNSQFRSTGILSFESRNNWKINSGLNLDLSYLIHEKINNKDNTPLRIQGEMNGFEDNARTKHKLNILFDYKGVKNDFSLRTGYDLRESDTGQIDGIDRFRPIHVDFSTRILPTVYLNQYLTYEPSIQDLSHATADLKYQFNKNFQVKTLLHHQFRENDNNFTDVDQRMDWNPKQIPWRIQGHYKHAVVDEGNSELNFLLMREFEIWELGMEIQHIEDRDTQLSLEVDFLGFQNNDD